VSRALSALLLLLAAAAAVAQVESDTVPFGRTIPLEEEIEREMAGAKWKLGPVRLLPQISLRNVGYDSNVLGTPEDDPDIVSDWTATIGAGVRLLLPLGGKVYLRGDVIPEYTWYLELEQRRLFQGRYGAGLYAFFNRLHFDAGASYADSTGYLNSETQALVRTKSKSGSTNLEIELLRNLSLWAGAQAQEAKFEPLDDLPIDVEDPSDLDRDAWGVRGGLRYGFRRDFKISVGVEKTETEFLNRPLSDYETTAWLVGVSLDRGRLFANAIGGQRRGEPLPGSAFPEYDTFTGSGFVSVPVSRFDLRFYGRRIVVPSTDPDAVYYIEARAGAGVRMPVVSRVWLQAYGEVGDNTYPARTSGGETIPETEDKIEAYGGGVQIAATDTISVDVLAFRTVTEFGAGGGKRAIFRVITNLTFGGLLP
jgi:hypothetical protein